jgi:hypothetical protein
LGKALLKKSKGRKECKSNIILANFSVELIMALLDVTFGLITSIQIVSLRHQELDFLLVL